MWNNMNWMVTAIINESKEVRRCYKFILNAVCLRERKIDRRISCGASHELKTSEWEKDSSTLYLYVSQKLYVHTYSDI